MNISRIYAYSDEHFEVFIFYQNKLYCKKRAEKHTVFWLSFFVVLGFSCSMMRQGCNTMRQLFAAFCFLLHLCNVKKQTKSAL